MDRTDKYEIIGTLHNEGESVVYLAREKGADTKVWIVSTEESYPSLGFSARLKNEYEVLNRLNHPTIPKALGLELFQHKPSLILEALSGAPLTNCADALEDLEKVLELGIQMSEALSTVHQAGVIHLGVEPNSIYYDAETSKAFLDNFSFASIHELESREIENSRPNWPHLPYISPEQTGRMNRKVDHRSDLYSLGVVLYELITGQHPFAKVDAVGLIHAHIAQAPQSPRQFRAMLPEPIAEVVLKLLEKNAENRYQSARGLQHDLEVCLREIRTTGTVAPFKLGSKDISGKFGIPQKLYGRDSEIAYLTGCYETAAGGVMQRVLIHGHSGVGKSSLVNELSSIVNRRKGFLVHGKYEQLDRNSPYHGLFQAIRDLLQEILSLPQDELRQWGDHINKTVYPNGQLIVDALPEVELIIGKQQPVGKLPPVESKNRFSETLSRFVTALATPRHPLVIFLDDLHWADPATLKFLESFGSSSDPLNVLLVGAYRDNEVNASHPLTLTLRRMADLGHENHELKLGPLGDEAVNKFLADTLDQSEDATKPLTEIVQRVASGNPFFISQYVKSLYDKWLLKFDYEEGWWQYNLKDIQALDISDDAVEMVMSKVNTCGKDAIKLLVTAAAAGNRFSLDVLAKVHGVSPKSALYTLWEAVEKGVVQPVDNNYLLIRQLNEDQDGVPDSVFKFSHDRMQQAVYALLSDDKRTQSHYDIGQELLKEYQAGEDNLFDTVNQLNRGRSLIQDPGEKHELGKLNLLAGQKAQSSNAYDTALSCFGVVIELWGDSADRTNLLEVYMGAAECAYIVGRFEHAEEYFRMAERYAESAIEKARICSVQVGLYNNLSKLDEALSIGLKGLSLLGIKPPKNAGKLHVVLELIAVRRKIKGRTPQQLMEIPETDNQESRLAQFIMSQLQAAAFNSNGNLLAWFILRSMRLMLDNGMSLEAYTSAIAGYAAILGMGFGKYKDSWDLTRIGFERAKLYEDDFYLGRANFAMGSVMINFSQHSRSSIPYLEDAYQLGVQNGDFTQAALVSLNLAKAYYFTGHKLNAVEGRAKQYMDFATKIKYDDLVNYHQSVIFAAKELKGNGSSLTMQDLEEKRKLEERLDASGYTLVRLCHRTHQLTNRWHLGDLDSALKLSEEIGKESEALQGSLMAPEYHLFSGLAQVESIRRGRVAKTAAKRLKKHLKALEKWSEHAPMNFAHKRDILKAEQASLKEDSSAVMYFEQAIRSAKDNQFPQHAALAQERLALHHLRNGHEEKATIHLDQAHKAYWEWDAKAKCDYLKEAHPELMKTVSLQDDGAKEETLSQRLDLSTVMKANSIISKEIVLDQLLGRMMDVMVENAGAERGMLLLKERRGLVIRAEKQGPDKNTLQFEDRSADDPHSLPQTIINYVSRTHKPIVLSNALADPSFAEDPYVVEHKPKSVICTPILKQGVLMGLVYLENNLSNSAFTQGRLEMLELLAAQSAISLENASLYDEMEERVQERTQQVVKQKEEISAQADELKDKNSKLQELSEFKENMTSMIVHDLKNPLSAILLTSENLPEDKQVPLVSMAAKEMLNMVTNILDVYKYEQTSMTLLKQEMELQHNLDKAIEQVVFLADDKRINILNKIPAGLTVEADREIIARVWVNLLTNAVKYTPPSGTITITSEAQEDGHVKLEISDTGSGIKAEAIDHIFGKFKQSEAKKSGKADSTGLGLTFCKMAIENHGGQIGVESEYGQGATFWFTLPNAAQIEVDSSGSRIAEGMQSSLSPLSAEARTILLPYAKELQSTPIYKVSAIRKLLQDINDQDIDEVISWKDDVRHMVNTGNEKGLIENLKMIIDADG